MALLKQIEDLISIGDADERELIEAMVENAAEYVQAVIHNEVFILNLAGREGAALREGMSDSDSARSKVHNSLISRVDIVNRICLYHNLPKIYNGSSERREYGDFAIELVSEVFAQRY